MTKSPAPADTSFSCARRQVLLGAGVGGVALIAAGCSSSKSTASTASATTKAPSTPAPPTGLIALKDVPSDAAISVTVPLSVSSQQALLLTQSGGKLTALDATCTHMGCKVAPAGTTLACPCHGSIYTLTGGNVSGPAPAPLHTVAVRVSGGEVVLA